MFSGLRLRLTLLYALAGLALVALVAGGAYLVVARYFRDVTDLALQHKMTHEFHALAAPIPPELAPADRDWSILRGELDLLPRARPGERRDHEDEGDDHEGENDDDERPILIGPTAYDAELAAIYVLPLDTAGRLIFDPNPASAPLAPDTAALRAALVGGSDVRTIVAPDGRRVRILTYRLTRVDGPAALQLGRVLNDQELMLRQLAFGLFAIGALSIVLLSAASWWLAGRALRPAQDAWERQQRFIASASHELRAPLTLLRASAEVALRATPPADADGHELLGDVLAEADHMRGLVDDLLTLSHLDSGHLPLAPATVEIPPLLAEFQRQAARLGAERGVTVRLGQAAGTVRADPERLRQVLLILLDNALRYTPAGGSVCIAAAPQGRAVRISVSDTGCGIAPEHLPHIFERFYRVDPARGHGGNVGLGLSIAHALITAMGGRIGAESTPGRGATIWLTLPAAQPE